MWQMDDLLWIKALGIAGAWVLAQYVIRPMARSIEAWFAGRRLRQ
jgi:hypothetical protein